MSAIGLNTIVKFFESPDKDLFRNRIISKTLGKLGVVDGYNYDTLLESGEFWKVQIMKESHPGTGTGCFILKPIEVISIDKLIYIPIDFENNSDFEISFPRGSYPGGLLIVSPKKYPYWIFCSELKDYIFNRYNLHALLISI